MKFNYLNLTMSKINVMKYLKEQIDELVYGLYGLSEEEIRTIESKK
jgi:hypothetical protein